EDVRDRRPRLRSGSNRRRGGHDAEECDLNARRHFPDRFHFSIRQSAFSIRVSPPENDEDSREQRQDRQNRSDHRHRREADDSDDEQVDAEQQHSKIPPEYECHSALLFDDSPSAMCHRLPTGPRYRSSQSSTSLNTSCGRGGRWPPSSTACRLSDGAVPSIRNSGTCAVSYGRSKSS